MTADVGKDSIFAEEHIVGLCECTTGLVLIVVGSELGKFDDFLNVGGGSELELMFGSFRVANENANLSGFRVASGLGEGDDLALRVTLDGNFMKKDFNSDRGLLSDQLHFDARLRQKIPRVRLQRSRCAEYLR